MDGFGLDIFILGGGFLFFFCFAGAVIVDGCEFCLTYECGGRLLLVLEVVADIEFLEGTLCNFCKDVEEDELLLFCIDFADCPRCCFFIATLLGLWTLSKSTVCVDVITIFST